MCRTDVARSLVVAAIIGCSGPQKPEPPPANHAPADAAEPPMSIGAIISAGAQTARCLPVVAKACGCTYDCALGMSKDQRQWRVTWSGSELAGAIERYCVAGQCTDVFAVDLVCDGICPPKPARTDCVLVSDPVVDCKR